MLFVLLNMYGFWDMLLGSVLKNKYVYIDIRDVSIVPISLYNSMIGPYGKKITEMLLRSREYFDKKLSLMFAFICFVIFIAWIFKGIIVGIICNSMMPLDGE